MCHVRPVAAAVLAGLFGLGATVDAEADLVVVANEHAGTLSLVDPESPEEARALKVGGDPHNLAATPDGARVVVTHEAAGLVSIADPRRRRILAQLDIPGGPHGVAIARDGRRAVIGAEAGRALHVIDLPGMRTMAAFDLPFAPHNVAIARSGLVWVAAQREGVLAAFDLEAGQAARTVNTGASPHDLAVSPADGALWVTNWASRDVHRLPAGAAAPEIIKIGGRQAHTSRCDPTEERPGSPTTAPRTSASSTSPRHARSRGLTWAMRHTTWPSRRMADGPMLPTAVPTTSRSSIRVRGARCVACPPGSTPTAS